MQKPKQLDDLVPVEGQILTGSLFSEPVRVATVRPTGAGAWVLGVVGVSSERYRSVTLTAAELSTLRFTEQAFTYAGDAQRLRLGLQAYSLGIAYEFDPYFGLSISRVDPLPHLSPQGVERMASVLVLPHPDKNQPQMQNLHPDPETEAIAMRAVMEYERSQQRQVEDVHEKNLGYDITSLDTASGELRLIEIKGLAGETGIVALTPNEKRVADDRRDRYWLYVVTRCKQPDGPRVMLIGDPARLAWHELKKVEHYQLPVSALTPAASEGPQE